ncbi:AIR synthase [Fervidicella metallireducens AeB]|uniref:AIR synthase n=1 Tax=Fervidicella metallireducens AeB TaxID=1403537 RepID=A0A017RTP2_9CLOT|nr:AIR synthase family protein [Fervidicella metallireducens]EYE87829.1 AIR synthase [Fervidicella metallireducens AeB]
MQAGKLSNETLKNIIISNLKKNNNDILIGPDVGEDCAIIKFQDEVCVLTTDPITAAAKNAGTLGVHICCNDIASAGVRPLGVLVTILAPLSAELNDIKTVMDEVKEACDILNIDVLGGHTEVTDAVNKMVLSITAIGKGKIGEYVTTGGAKVDDDIVVTGFAGLEGTVIIANDYFEHLKRKLDEKILKDAQSMMDNISVVKVGQIASDFGVNAMHDATEGGILGAIWETAEASGKGVHIFQNKIPVKDVTLKICHELNIDPLRLISSGCMVITCNNGAELCNKLRENGINAEVVGKITESRKIITTDNGDVEIMPPESDEIYRIKV